MSFTEDELQSFNDILERKLLEQRQELDASLEQRCQHLANQIIESQKQTNEVFMSLLGKTHTALDQHFQTQQETLEKVLTDLRDLNTQLQQMREQQTLPAFPDTVDGGVPSVGAIEFQTDLSLDDLVEAISRSLDGRLREMQSILLGPLRQVEQRIGKQLEDLEQMMSDRGGIDSRELPLLHRQQAIFQGLDQLQHIVESMQVVMTANHALLSNRLHHHQQLPLDRAHPKAAPVTRVLPTETIGGNTATSRDS